jgi:hypothetical protein
VEVEWNLWLEKGIVYFEGCPFVAFEAIRNNEWLRINKSEDCDMYRGTNWSVLW